MCLLLAPLAAACARPNALAAIPNPVQLTPEVVVTATPLPPNLITPQNVRRPLSIPIASPAERKEASPTWLYLSSFQSFNVSIIDPKSGHTIREIRTTGDRAGVAVAPDGTRLYVIDGQIGGMFRIYDAATWQVMHEEPVPNFATLFANPVSLSGDGHWLVVSRYNWQRGKGSLSLFDTRRLQFLPDNAVNALPCGEYSAPPRLVGRQGHRRLYVECAGSMTAVDSETWSRLWQAPTPVSMNPDFALAPDGEHLFGLYPQVDVGYDSGGNGRIIGTDLLLYVWETAGGRVLKKIELSDQVSVPSATFGRGEAGYLRVAPDGTRLFVVWEDAVWTVVAESLRVSRTLKLPASVDGVGLSDDGRELYMLPSTVGDLSIREHGLWTVDTNSLKLVRRATDWPKELDLFNITLDAAPAPRSAPNPKQLREECPVTMPVAVADSEIPNDSWSDPIHSPGWYRSADGKILAPADTLHVGGNKFGWLRPAGAQMRVTGRRLDRDAPPMGASIPCCYPGAFQVSGLYFPTGGCWEVEAKAEASVLRFIVHIDGPSDAPVQQVQCKDLQDAVRSSDGIIVGKELQSERDSRGYAWQSVSVGQVWKNPYGGEFTGIDFMQGRAEPLLEVGHTYLLFLKGDPFQIVCPNQTLARVIDNQVIRLDNSGQPLWSGMTLEAVESEIKAVLSSR